MTSLDSAIIKGLEGELIFKNYLDALQQCYNFKYIYNVNVYKSFGNSATQIDFCVLTKQQFLCIEIKNWFNTIYPSDENYWTVLKENMEKISVTNPFKQNETHCKALRNCFGYQFENYVLFSDFCNIKPRNSRILNFSDFQIVLSDLEKEKEIYSDEEINSVYDGLCRFKNEYIDLPISKKGV